MHLDLRPDQQPTILRAACALPAHACGPVIRRGFRAALPVLVTHRHGTGTSTVRLLAHRPWEVSAGARLGLMTVFEVYGAVGALAVGSKAIVARSLVEFTQVPDVLVPAFVADLVAALVFERAV